MATMRRANSKTAIGQQRANLRQSARHKQFVGAGAAEGRRAELAKVRRMQEVQQARAEADHLRKPVSALVADLVGDGVRLARTLVAFPFRMAAALRGHRTSAV
jgi:hypothetical protein